MILIDKDSDMSMIFFDILEFVLLNNEIWQIKQILMLCNTSKKLYCITTESNPSLEVILNDDSLNSIVLSKLYFLNIKNLKIDVSIPDDHFEQLLELIKNSSLERLNISTICYGEEEEDKVYKFFDPELYKNKDLTHLNIAGNDIGYQGALKLAQLLPYLNKLEYLDISGNRLGVKGAEVIAKANFSKNISWLNLSCNYICARGCDSFSRVLGQFSGLKHLNLGNNMIESEGASSLADVLTQCSVLSHLDLSGNEISDDGLASIASVFPYCPALAHLDLSCNSFNRLESLTRVLGQCSSLTNLILCCNGIGPTGAENLSPVLPQCLSLVHLNLCNCGIGLVMVETIRSVSEQCSTLKSLDLSYNEQIDTD